MSASLVVSELSVRAGDKRIVDTVSMSAATGQITGLIGPNGAGKSTLMRALLGLISIERGTVVFDHQDLLALPRRTRAQFTAYVEQTGAGEARLTAHEVVALGRIPFQSVWQSEPNPADQAAIDDALAAVGMGDFAHRLFHTLSGGEQQRLQIARAFAQQPRLLLLDEPTNHLDLHAQLSVMSLLKQRAAAGATVLVALHDLNLAATFCDSLIVMQAGRLVVQGPPDQVLTPALLRTVYGVEALLLKHPMSGRPVLAYELAAPGLANAIDNQASSDKI